MELRFYEDPETGEPHIYNHGITEDEVRQVLAHPGEDRPSADESRTALGQTRAGRYLRVIYVPDEGGESAFVVTAYELRGKQLKVSVHRSGSGSFFGRMTHLRRKDEVRKMCLTPSIVAQYGNRL